MPCIASEKRPGRSWKKGALCPDCQGEPGGVVPPPATVPRRAAPTVYPGAGAAGVRHGARPSGAAGPPVDGGGGGGGGGGGASARGPGGALGAGEEERPGTPGGRGRGNHLAP